MTISVRFEEYDEFNHKAWVVRPNGEDICIGIMHRGLDDISWRWEESSADGTGGLVSECTTQLAEWIEVLNPGSVSDIHRRLHGVGIIEIDGESFVNVIIDPEVGSSGELSDDIVVTATRSLSNGGREQYEFTKRDIRRSRQTVMDPGSMTWLINGSIVKLWNLTQL